MLRGAHTHTHTHTTVGNRHTARVWQRNLFSVGIGPVSKAALQLLRSFLQPLFLCLRFCFAIPDLICHQRLPAQT